MSKSVILVILSVFLYSLCNAATRTSTNSGLYLSPVTWDCLCIPAATDDIVIATDVSTFLLPITVNSVTISSGGNFSVQPTLTITKDLIIKLDGKLENRSTMTVGGNYRINGTHSGDGDFILKTGGLIEGTGEFIKSGRVIIDSGVYTTTNATTLNFSTSRIYMFTDSRILNNGDITVESIEISGTNSWDNLNSSTLRVNDFLDHDLILNAHFPNNTVFFQKMTTTQSQEINHPTNGYFNLYLLSSSVNLVKIPVNDLIILNDLSIDNCTFDSQNGTIVYNVKIGGTWKNISGNFESRTSTIVFGGPSGIIYSHLSSERFYEIEFANQTRLECGIDVSNLLMLSNFLDMNGYEINVSKDWHSSGSYSSGGGIVFFRSSNTSYVTGFTEFDNVTIHKSTGIHVEATGTMRILGTLSMSNGTLQTHDNVVIASNVDQTGRLHTMGNGIFQGDLIVERYLNFASNDWHLLGVPVYGSTIANWSGDFITTGFPGADYPSFAFNNITSYDETVPGHKDIGFSDILSDTEAIPAGEGRRVYLASGYNLLSVKGPAVTGTFTWSLDNTDTGDPPMDGWNLIANPYPSTIDWDKNGEWFKSGVKDAIYVWGGEGNQYTSYIAGVGTNGGTQFIPSSQAFWVQTEADLPILDVTENAKSNVDEQYRTMADQYLKIKMRTGNGLSDEVALRVHHEASNGFDSNWDAYKFRSEDLKYPSISLRSSDDLDLSIYSLGSINENSSVAMPIHVGISGAVRFSITEDVGFPTEKVYLYDAEEEEYHLFSMERDISIPLEAGDYSNRFFLMFDKTDVSKADIGGDDVTIWSTDDYINIQSLIGRPLIVDVSIYNELGQLILKENSLILNELLLIDAQYVHGLVLIHVVDQETGVRYSRKVMR